MVLARRRKRIVDLQQPPRPSPNVRLGGKIDIWIEKELWLAAVDRDEDARVNFERFRTGAHGYAREIFRELFDHVLAPAHPRDLRGIKIITRLDLLGFAVVRIVRI